MTSKRVFSEQEAAEIMQRAVRLQEQSSESEKYTPGITVEELKKIAIEAGIDLDYVDKAIAGIDYEESSTVGPFNLTEEFTRVVEGEIDPNDFDKILALFKHSQKNQLKQVGRSLSGPATTGVHYLSVNIESRNGRTKISTKYVPLFAYLIGLHGPVIASAILLGTQIEMGRPWLGVGLAATLLTIGGGVFRWLVQSGRTAVKKLTGEIAVVVEEARPLRENFSASSSATVENENAKQELEN